MKGPSPPASSSLRSAAGPAGRGSTVVGVTLVPLGAEVPGVLGVVVPAPSTVVAEQAASASTAATAPPRARTRRRVPMRSAPRGDGALGALAEALELLGRGAHARAARHHRDVVAGGAGAERADGRLLL